MECNVGGTERNVRLGIGAAATGAGLFLLHSTAARAAALTVGAIGLLTGLTHYCPVSQALGRNTCHQAEG